MLNRTIGLVRIKNELSHQVGADKKLSKHPLLDEAGAAALLNCRNNDAIKASRGGAENFLIRTTCYCR